MRKERELDIVGFKLLYIAKNKIGWVKLSLKTSSIGRVMLIGLQFLTLQQKGRLNVISAYSTLVGVRRAP